MRAWTLAALVAAAPLGAGCLGGSDDGAPTNDVDPDPTATRPDVDPAPAPHHAWAMDNRTGTAESISAGGVIVLDGAFEDLGVSEGVDKLFVNVTATGGELLVRLSPPSCVPTDEADDVQQLLLGCENEIDADTEGGTSSASIDAPEVGDWTIGLFCTGNGPCSVDYVLSLAQRTPAA